MTVTLKTLAKLSFTAQKMAYRRKVMKDRVKMAAAMRHKETCATCSGLFTAMMDAKAFQAAGVETENLMNNLLSKNLH